MLQYSIGETGFRASVSRVGEVFCSLFFLTSKEKDMCLNNNVDFLETWFDGLTT